VDSEGTEEVKIGSNEAIAIAAITNLYVTGKVATALGIPKTIALAASVVAMLVGNAAAAAGGEAPPAARVLLLPGDLVIRAITEDKPTAPLVAPNPDDLK